MMGCWLASSRFLPLTGASFVPLDAEIQKHLCVQVMYKVV